MTENDKSLSVSSAFFDETLEGNISIFFTNNGPSEAPPSVASETGTTEATQTFLLYTPDTIPNQSRQKVKILAAIGGAAIVCLGLLGALDSTKNPTRRHSTSTELSISLRSLPRRLPKAVRTNIEAVGEVDDEIYPSQTIAATSTDYETDAWGSAVEIRPDIVLTAGHVIGSPNNQISSSTECQQVTFTNFILRDFLVSEYGTTSAKPEPGIPDLEVLALPHSSSYEPTYEPTPKVTIAPKPPQTGEDLFFVNYEPNIKRGSSSNYWDSRPAIYGGVYEGKTSYGDYDVITGLRSYGQISNNSSIGGASGGAVFNAKGQLIGVSIRASLNSANNEIVSTSSVKQYEQEDRVKFKGLKPNTQVTDSIVQPVTHSLINQYVEKEHTITQNCFPQGGEE